MGDDSVRHPTVVSTPRKLRSSVENENKAIQTTGEFNHRAERYYRYLFDNAGVAMISTVADLTIRTWNNAAATMFGASRAGLAGEPIGSIIPAEGRDAAERMIRDTIETHVVNSFEFQHRDANGNPRTLAVTLSPIVDDDGDDHGALACFRDITRRINLEVELGQQNKMASLYRMAGALAHHLNNILGGAVTSVDYALAIDDPNIQNRALLRTSDVLARASKLTDALLAFAEGDHRHQDTCDLREIIRSVAEYMEPEMVAQNVNLDLSLGDLPDVPVPLAQIITVIENILHNAVDAMPNGGTATLRAYVKEGSVVMSISDTGCGLNPADLHKVFDPFYSTKSPEGMDFDDHPGLGLTVAHGILQSLGHTISIESTLGESTTVFVHFTPSAS